MRIFRRRGIKCPIHKINKKDKSVTHAIRALVSCHLEYACNMIVTLQVKFDRRAFLYSNSPVSLNPKSLKEKVNGQDSAGNDQSSPSHTYSCIKRHTAAADIRDKAPTY